MLDQPSLLLDIGNSSVKYSLFDGQQKFEALLVKRTSLDALSKLNFNFGSIFFSSVLDEDSNQVVFDVGHKLEIPVFQCKSQHSQYNIINAYKTPTNMGDDRWMAIIGGVTLCGLGEKSNILVIDSGSAITCDFVASGTHLGGWIAPGIKMLRDTVVTNTKRVFDREHDLNMLALGTDTPECVSNGALAQVSGMIKQAIFIMQQNSDQFDIYLSGGDAKNLTEVINQTTLISEENSVHYVENLVLVGLARIASEKSM